MPDPSVYTVAWICAVRVELVAARALFEEEHPKLQQRFPNDTNIYALGKIAQHNVVIACLAEGEYGTASAAGVAVNLLRSFPNIRFGLMVGIGGGVPSVKNDIRLGDVVVSRPGNGHGGVIQYDFGKMVQGESLKSTGFLNQPPELLRTALTSLMGEYDLKGHRLLDRVNETLAKWPRLRSKYSRPIDEDILQDSNFVRRGDTLDSSQTGKEDLRNIVVRPPRKEDEDDPAIHYGLIASANRLMKDAVFRDELAASEDVLCFEMEAAGLMNRFPCLIIRGICDYADTHKNDKWQPFAAMMAAAYAVDLLGQIPQASIEDQPLIQEILGHVHSEVVQTGKTVHEMNEDVKKTQILQWLSPPDPSTNLNKAKTTRSEATGIWFVESDVFQEWKAGSRKHVWLYGDSGCGKTVLSSSMMEHLVETQKLNTLFFFFDFSDARKQKLDHMLRSLTCQLYCTTSTTRGELLTAFKAHHNGLQQPSTQKLQDILYNMLNLAVETHIVLDALDECIDQSDRRELLEWMRHVSEHSPSRKLHLMVTSRPEPDIQSSLSQWIGFQNRISVNKEFVDADIRTFITKSLSDPNFQKWTPEALTDVTNGICGMSGGMFRWAACQLQVIWNCQGLNQVKEALKSMPKTLDATYDRTFQSILDIHKSDAIRLLQLLLYSSRPLYLDEVVDAIAVCTDLEPPFEEKNRAWDQNQIQNLCPGFISIVMLDQQYKPSEQHWQRLRPRRDNDVGLQLAHFSVKQYLQKRESEGLCEFKGLLETEACAAIAKVCLSYIGVCLPCDFGKFPFCDYAVRFWMDHARQSDTNRSLQEKILSFLDQGSRCYLEWSLKYHELCRRESSGGSPLHDACFGGLSKIVRLLLEEGANVNELAEPHGTPLLGAVASNHHDLTYFLLDRGADIDAQNSIGKNALTLAMERDDEPMFRHLLCVRKANPNIGGGEYGSTLHAACHVGRKGIIQLLIASGVNVNVESGPYNTALQTACDSFHNLYNSEEVIQLLLDAGADVNLQGGKYNTALQAATFWGKTDIVQLLLDARADVNLQGGKYITALQAATFRGETDIVQLLLDAGADVNLQGGEYNTALQAASDRGRTDIVQLLLDAGADVNLQGGRYNTALQAASRWGKMDIVQLLLDAGADVNLRRGRFGSALEAALHFDRIDVIQRFLSAGADFNVEVGTAAAVLQAAAKHDKMDIIQSLLESGVQVNCQRGEFGTALQPASHSGVDFPLSSGADVHLQGGRWGNALQAASHEGHEDIARQLIDHGAVINFKDKHHLEALGCAEAKNHGHFVHPLLETAEESHVIDQGPSGGCLFTLVETAVVSGHIKLAERLMEMGKVGSKWLEYNIGKNGTGSVEDTMKLRRMLYLPEVKSPFYNQMKGRSEDERLSTTGDVCCTKDHAG